MRHLFKLFKPYWWYLVLLVGSVTGSVAASLSLPDYMAKIINQGIVGEDLHLVWVTGVVMLVFSLAGGLSSIATSWLASRLSAGYSRDIRAAAFAKVEQFSLAEFNQFSTASLITRTTNDITQIQTVLVMILRMSLMAPIMGTWAIVKAYHTAPSMTWIMAASVGSVIAIIAAVFIIAVPKYRILQKLTDRLNLVAREMLTGLRVVRAFNRGQAEEEKFDVANKELTRVNLFINRVNTIMMPFMFFILSMTMLGIVWFGAKKIDLGSLQIGNMVAFMQYAMQSMFAFFMITMVIIMIPRASVSFGRLAEILNTEPKIRDPKETQAVDPKQLGRVEFDHVTFAYGGADAPILQDITFTAEPGETTAIVGSTGSGKTTLINLIPRFYDPTNGEVRVHGVDIRQLKLEQLYQQIGYVPQRSVLFSGTVDSNIGYGAPNADRDSLAIAADIAQAKDFISQLEGRFDAPISQGGKNLSGGQKQRLSIARAIARKPEIFIFDDSFSALDFTTDAKLRAALKNATSGKTVLIVAQRISTIINADKIIVLEEGRIVGQGKHDDLMKSCQVYREIALSQLSETELQTAPRVLATEGGAAV